MEVVKQAPPVGSAPHAIVRGYCEAKADTLPLVFSRSKQARRIHRLMMRFLEEEATEMKQLLRQSVMFRWMSDASLDKVLDKLVLKKYKQVRTEEW